MKKTKYDEAMDGAVETIKQLKLDKGKLTIYTTLEHVSKSGMMRKISAFVMVDNEPVCIARSVRCDGCGMDMGFDLAYQIFCAVHPCPKQGETNEYPYQKYLKHHRL